MGEIGGAQWPSGCELDC